MRSLSNFLNSFSLRLKSNWKKILKYAFLISLVITVCFHIAFLIVIGINILGIKFNNPQKTALMSIRNNYDNNRIKTPSFIELEQIPLDIVRLVIFIEDYDFYEHMGFDWESIQFAITLNQKLGYLAYGGSTITQQLARTLFLTQEKNYFRKYLELLVAIELELLLDKRRILELYLNYIEWGDNIYGIVDASYNYYNKEVRNLTEQEKLELITIMPNPLTFNPHNYHENEVLMKRYYALQQFHEYLLMLPPVFKSTIKEAD